MSISAGLVFLWCAAACGQEREPRTGVPFTYVLDYGSGHADNANYIKEVREAPPHLLHLGTDTPCHSYFGAAFSWVRLKRRLAGESVPEPDYRLEFEQRMKSLTRLASDLHAAGVKLVTPYVCMMTIGGDHAKRYGFWEMYDHWDAYTAFGIGSKPSTDPSKWNQQLPDGSPKYFYRHDHPPYKPMFRYAICINHPSWRQYMMWVIRTTAQCGFDGVFVDNANSQRCYCPRCQEGFRRYIERKFSANEIETLFGDRPSLASDGNGFLWVQTQLFWAASIRDFLNEMRREGEKVRGHFYIFPNGLRRRPQSALTSFRDADLAMDEYSVGEFGTHPGEVAEEVIAGIRIQHINDNIFTHCHTLAANNRVRSALLTRAGYPERVPEYEMNPNVGALGLAEAAGFSGGGTFLHRPLASAPLLGPVRITYNTFFSSHSRLYEGLTPYGQVAVACFAMQRYYDNGRHVQEADDLLHNLMERHVLVSIITENNFSSPIIGRYRALLLPRIAYLSDEQVRCALDYAEGGGTLMVSEGTGDFDDKMRRREENPLARYVTSGSFFGAVERLLRRDAGFVGVLPSEGGSSTVRVAAYCDDGAAPKKVVVHLVNYGVPLGRNGKPVRALDNVQVSLPLRQSIKSARILYARPDEPEVELEAAVRDDCVVFVLPTLRIYGVCEVALQK